MKTSNCKKMISLIMCVAMILSMAACGQKAAPAAPAAPAASAAPAAPAAPAEKKVDFPTETINMVVPFAAGGGTDIMTRALTATVDLAQPMVVTNMAGGGSSIGAMEVYHADPDGHTLLSVVMESVIAGVYAGTYPEADSVEKLVPVCSVAEDGIIIIASKASGITSLADLEEYCAKNPGKVTMAGVGSMSLTNACAEQFIALTGLDIKYVPYDSGANSRTAVMGGHEPLGIMCVSEAPPALESGDALPILVLSQERSEFYPDVPCIGESGDFDFDLTIHRSFFVPAGTPAEVINILEDAFEKALKNEDTQKTLRDLCYAPVFMGSEDLLALQQVKKVEMADIFEALLAAQ